MLFRFVLLALICITYGKQARKKTIYSWTDNIAAPILAYPDYRSCNKRCNNNYAGQSDTPYCCGRSNTAGTYFCCQYSTCCSLSYCCAPGYRCSDDGQMCSGASIFGVDMPYFIVPITLMILQKYGLKY